MPETPEDLRNYPCIVFDSPSLSPWRFRNPDTGQIFTMAEAPRLLDFVVSGFNYKVILVCDILCGIFTIAGIVFLWCAVGAISTPGTLLYRLTHLQFRTRY